MWLAHHHEYALVAARRSIFIFILDYNQTHSTHEGKTMINVEDKQNQQDEKDEYEKT